MQKGMKKDKDMKPEASIKNDWMCSCPSAFLVSPFLIHARARGLATERARAYSTVRARAQRKNLKNIETRKAQGNNATVLHIT